MGLIFYLSSGQTTSITGTSTERFLILKTFHLIEYAILFLLIYYALFKINISVFYSYVYAISDEFHQSFVPGRGSKFSDTLIDLVGIGIGIIVLKILLPYIKRKYKMSLLTRHV